MKPVIIGLVGAGVLVWGEWFILEAKARFLGLAIMAAGAALIAAALAFK